MAVLTWMLKTKSNRLLHKAVDNSSFFTHAAKPIFYCLRQASIKALIFQYFDSERSIHIETDTLGYKMGGIFCSFNWTFGQWHPLAFFFKKIIIAET